MFLDGQEVLLENRGFLLLAAFAEAPYDVVLTKAVLWEALNPSDAPGMYERLRGRAVEAQVSRVRVRLRTVCPDVGWFPNVWSVGWRLADREVAVEFAGSQTCPLCGAPVA